MRQENCQTEIDSSVELLEVFARYEKHIRFLKETERAESFEFFMVYIEGYSHEKAVSLWEVANMIFEKLKLFSKSKG